MKSSHHSNQKGFSLAEAMLATVILGIAATGVLLPFSAGATIRADGIHRTSGAVLAANLMEKIANTPFDQIIPSGFNSYIWTEAQGQVLDVNGQVFTDPSYAKFSRSTTCTYWPQGKTAVNAEFVLATVSVYYDGKSVAVINRLISK